VRFWLLFFLSSMELNDTQARATCLITVNASAGTIKTNDYYYAYTRCTQLTCNSTRWVVSSIYGAAHSIIYFNRTVVKQNASSGSNASEHCINCVNAANGDTRCESC
jgi:hypothetical protein